MLVTQSNLPYNVLYSIVHEFVSFATRSSFLPTLLGNFIQSIYR